MAVPKKRTSKSRKNMRRAHHKVERPTVITCECGNPALPHRICPECGKYADKRITRTADEQT